MQGGALLRDLDAATQAHGLAVPAGVVGHTGVGGLTLGGGMGWLTRQAGLSIDNLVSAEVVVADGRILRAADDENADLFWAIRGGGGNFGVVTEFEFRLHEVGPIVQFGLFFWAQEQAAEALRLMRDVIADLPRSLNAIPAAALTAPPAPFVPVEHHHKPGYALLVTGFGDPAEHQQVVDRIRAALPPLFELSTPMPYVAVQQLLDEANAWGFYGYEKGAYFEDLTDEVIEVVTEHAPRKSSPLSVLLFYRLDQAYSEVGEDDTAFGGGRTPALRGLLHRPVPGAGNARRRAAMGAVAVGRAASAHDGRSAPTSTRSTNEDEHRIRATYGAKYDRLARDQGQVRPRQRLPPQRQHQVTGGFRNPLHGVAIVGAFNTPQAKRLEAHTSTSVTMMAIRGALDDAGLRYADVDGLSISPTDPSRLQKDESLDWAYRARIGNVWAGSAMLAIPALLEAALAIASGQCSVVVVASGQAGLYTDRSSTAPWTRPANEFVQCWGLYTAAEYALVARRHMHQFGTTAEQLALAAATIRTYGAVNPAAVHFGARSRWKRCCRRRSSPIRSISSIVR